MGDYMKHTISIILLIFMTVHLNSQTERKHGLNSFDLYFGYRVYSQDFYKQLNTLNSIELNMPLKIIGIGTSGYFPVQRKGGFYGHFIYNQIIPQSIKLQCIPPLYHVLTE